MTKEALKLAAYGLEIILSSFEKDGKFVMKSMIRNELFDGVNLLLKKSKKVLAQPEEPADLHNRLADLHLYEEIAEHYAKCAISPEALRDWVAERVNTPPLPVQEPVARVAEVHMSRYTLEWTNGPLPEGTLLYATPQQRQWVGLTDTERNEIWKKEVGWGDPSHDDEDLMKAIEQALEDKNT